MTSTLTPADPRTRPDDPTPWRGTTDSAGRIRARRPRTCLEIRRIPVWPVLRLALVGSLAVAAALVGAVACLWWLAQAAGLVDQAEEAVTSLLGADDFRIHGGPLLVGVVMVAVVAAAIVTLAAVAIAVGYNLLAALGCRLEVEVTAGPESEVSVALPWAGTPPARPRPDGASDGHGNGSGNGTGASPGGAFDGRRITA